MSPPVSSTPAPLSRDEVVARVASDVPPGSYVNLGIGHGAVRVRSLHGTTLDDLAAHLGLPLTPSETP